MVSWLQMGRIPTTVLPAETSPAPEAVGGVPGPMGGQFGQQWDEQQFAPPQPAYQYGSPDALPQVLTGLYFACQHGTALQIGKLFLSY